MPGSGVNASNILQLGKLTKAIEFHSLASVSLESGMNYINEEMNENLSTVLADEYSIREMVKALKKL